TFTTEHAESALRVGEAFLNAAESLDEVQEHFLGRACAARILARYRPVEDEALQGYVGHVGHTVALHSDRPRTYGGYRFIVVESAVESGEPNAFAAPGGFVFVTSSLLSSLESEDQLAAVLAHEVAHVVARHGLKAIEDARFKGAIGTAIVEGTRHLSDTEVREAAQVLQASVGDVLKTILERGYSREQEMEADRLGITFAYRAGYDPAGLCQFLHSAEVAEGGPPRWLSTHPGGRKRVRASDDFVADSTMKGITLPIRTERFRRFVAR
ncbi:MAG: M48 family metalloprotease, partial [Planctomycetes bacterium]|nr:M48 family metalloprotease [Planctomycetota bacterium]